MRFEWDATKAADNLRKHGVDFPTATLVFACPVLLTYVEERSGEPRNRVIGLIGGVPFSIAYTQRGDVCRIISARRASRVKRRFYRILLAGPRPVPRGPDRLGPPADHDR